MNKAFYLIFITILVLGLTACGGNSSSSQSSGSSETRTTPTVEASPTPAGDPVAGKEKFSTTCIACHGPSGKGVPGLGKDMTNSEFIASKSDDELVEFIKVGRDPSDPLNTTGIAMPPKGGNPALGDEDLRDIVVFIRSLQQ